MRIYIGPHDIANLGQIYAKEFRRLGHKVKTTTKVSKDLYKEEYDVVLELQGKGRVGRAVKMAAHFLRNLNHDLYIFIFGDSLLPENLDLPILKILKKKIAMIFVGCDVRHWSLVEREATQLGIHAICRDCKTRDSCNLGRKMRRARMACKFADVVYACPDYAQLLKSYEMYWIALDPRDVEYRVPKNDPPRIVHAATNPSKKGTPYIRRALDRLKEEGYRFEAEIHTRDEGRGGTPNEELMAKLADADISIDQLLCYYGSYGMESMASGCATLGYGGDENLNKWMKRGNVPMIPATPDTIYERLKDLLNHPERIPELAEAGRKYVEEHHDIRKIARKVLADLGV